MPAASRPLAPTGAQRRAMYRDMVLTRCFDTQASALQRQGQLALWAPSLGQEAAQVGSAHALAGQDWVFPSYREHGVLQARGVALPDALALFRGADHGGWDTERHRVHLYTLVVGAQVLPAVGYAIGLALDAARGAPAPDQATGAASDQATGAAPGPAAGAAGTPASGQATAAAPDLAVGAAGAPAPGPAVGAAGAPASGQVTGAAPGPAGGQATGAPPGPAAEAAGAVIVYLGDGATSQGEVGEALVWAASCAAPVLFFIQNNGWAISTPTATQARVALARRGEGFGIPGERVDGNDATACFAATAAALERIRAGQGPQIVEAVTYRLGPHTTSDDPSRYRSPQDEAPWAARDPIALARAALEADGLADQAFFEAADAAGAALAAAARQRCGSLQPPGLEELFGWVYASENRLVAEELAAWQRGLAGAAQPAPELAGTGAPQ
ncbi:MAG: hypothetical protein LBD51_09730 [Bifidobacteriaceae bacterium]|jgi:pyruvate dehydrogenase E1 component alpha subunit|nr:hypothetical protein [Bifidobacteriaceae bacterium]